MVRTPQADPRPTGSLEGPDSLSRASAALLVHRARKRYGALQALDGVDLTLHPGQWIGLIGPNGAGKTTLMRSISGLQRLDSGRIALFGVPVEGRGSAGAGLGLVPQELALYPMLTARENLDVFGRLHGVGGETLQRRIDWALDWTGLGSRAEMQVHKFSEGMKRRLNIACGVLHEPRVVLLDEPTVGVDPQGRQRIWQMLDGLRSEGASLLQSSHQLDEIESRCDRMLILDRGQVRAEGTLAELAAHTILGDRRVTISLSHAPAGLTPESPFHLDGHVLHGTLHDVAAELPAVLERIRRAGAEIEGLRVEAPSLEQVFTELTGRELRE